MGIIKAAINAVGGALADSWLEAIQAPDMGDNIVCCPGRVITSGRSSNTKGNENIVSNGSKIHVYDNQFMILVDNGKIVDYTAEPGAYTVSNSSSPSLFNGQFGGIFHRQAVGSAIISEVNERSMPTLFIV